MNDLQLGLLAIGGVVILAVLIYNRWVTQRSAPKRSHPPADSGPAASDLAALDPTDGEGGRVEPVLDGAMGASATDPSDPTAVKHPIDKRPLLDPLIDVIVNLGLDGVVSGEAVLAAMPRSRRIGTKPFAVEGLNADGWEPVRAGQRYSALQAGVQLANRAGALNEIEYSEFIAKVQDLAESVQASVDFPDMMAEVARARELDQFAGDHDAQLGFTVRATRAAWSPGYLAQHAGQLGFVAGVLPGRMVLPGAEPGAAPILVLLFETQAALADDPEQAALLQFDLALDVPHVPRSEQPYVRLRDSAAALAKQMEGRITDDRGRPLSADTMDQIGADLENLYDTLESRDLAAGSVLARRLFS